MFSSIVSVIRSLISDTSEISDLIHNNNEDDDDDDDDDDDNNNNNNNLAYNDFRVNRN